jgi:hypothetical protein
MYARRSAHVNRTVNNDDDNENGNNDNDRYIIIDIIYLQHMRAADDYY